MSIHIVTPKIITDRKVRADTLSELFATLDTTIRKVVIENVPFLLSHTLSTTSFDRIL